MRLFEIILPIILTIHIIWPFTGRKRPEVINLLPALALIIVILHGFLEGTRWQMFPLYAITVWVFLASLITWGKNRRPNNISFPRGWRLAGLLSTLLVLAISTSLPALLPVPTPLPPSGPFAIGTRTMELTDPSRKEIYSGKDEARKFLIEIWYPAMPPASGIKPAPWMPEAKIVAPAIADYINLPHFFLDHLTLAKSSAYADIPANRSAGMFPVLIFSHGWNGFRQQSTFLMQELASHGYIVVAMEHPYGARLTVFPDGSLAANNPAALPKGKPDDEYEAAGRILVNQWAGDISYALDTLAKINQNDPAGQLSGLLNLNKVGVFGHSTGGGATIQFCGIDPRCKAGLTLDAFMRPVGLEVLDQGTRQPFFYMFSELWPFPRNTELFNRYYSHVSPSNHVVTILGADHYDFSDLPALSPLAPQLGLKGPINGARVQKIIDTYVLAFFDLQFKDTTTILFDGPQAAFPEVRYDH